MLTESIKGKSLDLGAQSEALHYFEIVPLTTLQRDRGLLPKCSGRELNRFALFYIYNQKIQVTIQSMVRDFD